MYTGVEVYLLVCIKGILRLLSNLLAVEGEKKLREIETSILQQITDWQHPFGNGVAYVLTFLGNELFYFLIIPLVYWCISKSFGIRLVYLFIVSIYINSWLKALFSIQRPVGIEGVQSLYVSSAEVVSHYPYDSFPSGHAQGSATLWGMIAYQLRNRLFWVFAVFLVASISLSRLYVGLHWPTDVLAGIFIAAFIIFLAVKLEKWIVQWPEKAKWFGAIALPIVMMLVFPAPEGMKYGGFLLGAGIGYMVEKKYIKMMIVKSVVKKAGALVIGLAGLFVIQQGVKMGLGDALLVDALRYALIGLWGLWWAPALFIKCRLYKRSRTK